MKKKDKKTTLRMVENICKWATNKGLNSKIYKHLRIPGGSVVKNTPVNVEDAEDMGLIP